MISYCTLLVFRKSSSASSNTNTSPGKRLHFASGALHQEHVSPCRVFARHFDTRQTLFLLLKLRHVSTPLVRIQSTSKDGL